MRLFYRAGAPPMLRLATAAQGLEAAGLAVAAVIAAIGTATGQSYRVSNGIDLAVLEFVVAGGLALIATGLARVRPWSRTPAAMAQVLCAVIGIVGLQGGQVAWGVPAVLLALAGLAGLFTPASLRALNRPSQAAGTAAAAAGPASPEQAPPKPPVPPAAKKAAQANAKAKQSGKKPVSRRA